MAKSNKNGTPVKDKMKRIIIGIGFLALLPCLGWTAELTGRDIAVKMDAVDTSKDYKRTAIMVISRKGQKLIRKMETYNKKYGSDERSLIKFIEPPDARGSCTSHGVTRTSSGMTICGSFFRQRAWCDVSAAAARRAHL